MQPSIYTDVFPLGRVLRRMLKDGYPINKIHTEVDRMIANGELELPDPRQQLPSKWWLVEHKDGHLSIDTNDYWHPIDPFHILCRERRPPPPAPVTIQSAGLIARRPREKTAALAEPLLSIEEQGIELLIKRMKRHQARGYTKSKVFYQKLLKRVLKLGVRKFEHDVWPVATTAPGVEPPKVGAPKKRK